ncbi:MAG: hypothetical protein MRQ09_05740 [Candidatus Midichloria sp.]|nr:hypothetical protein [Candidatus Midichloria sp.]
MNGNSSILSPNNGSEEEINNPFEENFCIYDDIGITQSVGDLLEEFFC